VLRERTGALEVSNLDWVKAFLSDAPPAKLGVRTHEVVIVDDVINVVLDDAPPNLPPGVTTRAAGEAAQ